MPRINAFTTPFPSLNFENTRKREFSLYSEEQRASVVYHWLKEGMSTRMMDVTILGYSGDMKSKGWQSMGIYRFLGLDQKHQAFFFGWKDEDIVAYFLPLCTTPEIRTIFYYFYDGIKQQTSTFTDSLSVSDVMKSYPEDETKNQTWIEKIWMPEKKNNATIEEHLLSLPDTDSSGKGKVHLKNHEVYYSNKTVKETVKNLYDFHCQVCGDVILRKGWKNDLDRVGSWKYLSADVHHILPLSSGGPDRRDNMICLCPTCHRKFHSGEFRLITKKDSLLLSDELLGHKASITQKHKIVLY